eukprot:5243-Pleurochrysis_carterae.AAC.1
MVRPFLSESLQRRILIVPADADLVAETEAFVPPSSLPFFLRRRAVAALLARRPSRSELLARSVLLPSDVLGTHSRDRRPQRLSGSGDALTASTGVNGALEAQSETLLLGSSPLLVEEAVSLALLQVVSRHWAGGRVSRVGQQWTESSRAA